MNTTEIGNAFESKSLAIIKRMIESEQLTHLAQYLKIYQHKEYYSHLRKKNIVFDLTVEVWPPGADRYSFIYIIECKDYNTRIPVNKIEDFHSKILQVAGVNVKGIFIANSPLMEGGYNIAESVGMMVIEGESADNFKIVLYRSNRDRTSTKLPFIKETADPQRMDQGTTLLEQLIDKQILSALQDNTDESRVHYGIDKLSAAKIEVIANEQLNIWNPDILTKANHISPKSLRQHLKDHYHIEIIDLVTEGALGSCHIENQTIGINPQVKDTPRELFVLAHEFGHYILHSKLAIGQQLYDTFSDAEYNFRKGKHDLTNPRHWIEWQANCFASCFVLPKVPFYFRLTSVQENLNKSKGKIYLDDQYQNRTDFNDIVAKLAHRFSVSKTSVIFKLKEMQLINDHSRSKTIGELIAEYHEDLLI